MNTSRLIFSKTLNRKITISFEYIHTVLFFYHYRYEFSFFNKRYADDWSVAVKNLNVTNKTKDKKKFF